jgi:DNA-binding response OmpR family regulator
MMEDLKVLLVDDEQEFVSTLAERLKLRGIPVEIAFDGEEAWRRIEAEPPDVMVLDLMMPGVGGMEVLQRLKSQKAATRVILLTGHGSTKDGIEGMRLGAFDYLMKPLDIEELIDKIRKASE